MAPQFSLCMLMLKLLPLISLGSAFQLYAYGVTLGGATLVYQDNKAYLVNGTTVNSTYADVYFSPDPSDSSAYLATFNTTTPGADLRVYIPTNDAESSQVGFTSQELSNQTTSGFTMYGSTLIQVSGAASIYTSKFYALPVQGASDGVFELIWLSNSTAMKNTAGISVALRNIPPSNATSATPISS